MKLLLSNRVIPSVAGLFLLLFAPACRTATREYKIDERGVFQKKITTSSPEAQKLFDQGLLLCYAFNHEEAERRFQRALQFDPNCAMAYWGLAHAAGPNINNSDMDKARNAKALRAARDAEKRMGDCNETERMLIGAMQFRYSESPDADQKLLNQQYSSAMRAAHHKYPNDPDVAVLFADSLMNLRPWDLWSKDGAPRPETPEIVATLKSVFVNYSNHPGANHAFIHAVEASPSPGDAEPAADRLRELIPEAGHLVHMPSHIDIRLGHYEKAILANLRGIDADRKYIESTGPGGFFAMYRAHNYHFLVYAAMFDGQSQLALRYAREMLESIPPEIVEQMPNVLDGILATPLHVMERFGMWDAILNEPQPDTKFSVARAFWHFARSLAFTARGHLTEAEREQQNYKTALEAVQSSRMMGNNSARTILNVGTEVIAGELEFRKGNIEKGFQHLREAVRLDDELAYDEPWGWPIPARHALGALLLESGRVDEAKEVYQLDLKRNPHNGWALHGLAECYRRLGRNDESEKVNIQFNEAWKRADITIQASCFCRAR
ncbi:MAG: tetratricopeptide repeat protein [Planctomycetota bacterium]